jgi:hypothetical protein
MINYFENDENNKHVWRLIDAKTELLKVQEPRLTHGFPRTRWFAGALPAHNKRKSIKPIRGCFQDCPQRGDASFSRTRLPGNHFAL